MWWFWDHLKQPLAKNNVDITLKINGCGWGDIKKYSPLMSEVNRGELEHGHTRILSKATKDNGWNFSKFQVKMKFKSEEI